MPDSPNLSSYFENCLFFSLSKLQREIDRMAESAFKHLGLAPNQGFVLVALNVSESLTPSQLAETLGLAPSTITRFVTKLETLGYCEKCLSGKIVNISITPKGRSLIPEIKKSWTDLLHKYTELYGQEEAKQLNQLIVTLAKKTKPTPPTP